MRSLAEFWEGYMACTYHAINSFLGATEACGLGCFLLNSETCPLSLIELGHLLLHICSRAGLFEEKHLVANQQV